MGSIAADKLHCHGRVTDAARWPGNEAEAGVVGQRHCSARGGSRARSDRSRSRGAPILLFFREVLFLFCLGRSGSSDRAWQRDTPRSRRERSSSGRRTRGTSEDAEAWARGRILRCTSAYRLYPALVSNSAVAAGSACHRHHSTIADFAISATARSTLPSEDE